MPSLERVTQTTKLEIKIIPSPGLAFTQIAYANDTHRVAVRFFRPQTIQRRLGAPEETSTLTKKLFVSRVQLNAVARKKKTEFFLSQKKLLFPEQALAFCRKKHLTALFCDNN